MLLGIQAIKLGLDLTLEDPLLLGRRNVNLRGTLGNRSLDALNGSLARLGVHGNRDVGREVQNLLEISGRDIQ